MQYILLIYGAEPTESLPEDQMLAEMEGYNAFTAHVRERGAMMAGEALHADRIGDDGPGPGRPDGHDRRPVRRDQGAARRVLPRRGGRPGRGHRVCRDDPGREARLHRGPADLSTSAQSRGRDRAGRRRRIVELTATHEVVDRLFREEQGRAVATLIRVLGDFDLAEEAVQEAFIAALETWPERGIPANPGAWITTTARNRAIDRLRRRRRLVEKTAEIARESELEATLSAIDPGESEDPMHIADDRLRLIFTCCHPALAMDARVALTLRTLGGLTTPEIARAFLVPEPTLAQRLVRAKKKIRDAGIPYRVPPADLLPERLDGVLRVLYLVFNEGYAASSGDSLIRRELSSEAIRLTRLVVSLLPDEPEATGLLALMLLHDARRDARTDADGSLVLLDAQDRARWDHDRIAEGQALTQAALAAGRPGPYQVQAAIAALHDEAPSAGETDWPQIADLYRTLMRISPTPVVELNLAAAVAMADGPAYGLAMMDGLLASGELDDYPYLHAARADLLRRLERWTEAEAAYARALDLTTNNAERAFLQRRIDEVQVRRRATGGNVA